MTTRQELDQEWEKLRKAKADFEAELQSSGNEFKLFAGNLDNSTTEEELKTLFAQFGLIKETCILRDREGKSKRSGFVKFYLKSCAEAAIAALHDHHTDKQARSPMAVRFARQKQQMPAQPAFGGFASTAYAPYAVAQQSYGMDQYAQANAYGQTAAYGQAMGQLGQMGQMGQMGQQSYTQTSYSDPYAQMGAQAALAYGQQSMQPQTSFQTYGAQATGYTQQSVSSGISRGGRGPPGSNLYVNNIDRMATEADVRAMFSEYGTVISVKLFSENGYGFVSYDNPQSAQNAISTLNGMQSADGTRSLEVSLKKEKPRYNPY